MTFLGSAGVARFVVVTADAGALVWLYPGRTLVHDLAAPRQWVASVGSDTAVVEVAGTALWLAAAWVALGLVSGAASALPGAVGRTARRVARVTLPRAVYRLAAGATGMGVVLAPVLADAAPSPARPLHGVTTPTPAWPTDDAVPVPRWPASAAPVAPNHHVQPAKPPGPSVATVEVAPGDSLWRIAAAHLPGHPSDRRVAAAWPHWYAANRAAIGSDPNYLTPGQVLAVPPLPEGDQS